MESFQYEIRTVITESLVYKTLFNTVVYGSNETHIIMHNLKTGVALGFKIRGQR